MSVPFKPSFHKSNSVNCIEVSVGASVCTRCSMVVKEREKCTAKHIGELSLVHEERDKIKELAGYLLKNNPTTKEMILQIFGIDKKKE